MDTASSRPRWLVALLLVIAAVAALAWLILRHQPAGESAGGADDAPTDPRVAIDRGTAPPTADGIDRWWGDEPPLPPIDAAFGEVFAELERRADLGQPKAACRLAVELGRCESAKQQVAAIDASIRTMQSQKTPPGTAPAVNKMIRQGRAEALQRLKADAERSLRTAEQCEAAAPVTPQQRNRYWRIAALAGHVPSMTEYAVGNGFRWNNVLNDLPGLAVYRREAEPLARRAAAAGDIRATLSLAAAYSSDNKARAARNFLTQLLPADDVEALALYQRASNALAGDPRPEAAALRSGVDDVVRGLVTTMLANEQAEANSRAQGLQRDWSSIDTSTLPRRDAALSGNLPDVDSAACASDRFAGP